MKTAWTLTKFRILLALRNRAFLFFSLVMPLGFLFLYAGIFARGEPRTVGFYLGPVLALTVMGGFWGLSIQLVMFREQGILRRFRLAPVGAGAVLLSSLLSNYLLTLPTIVVELLLAKWIYKVPSLGNLWGVFVLVTLGTLAFAAIGLIVASVTSTMQETQVINNAIWFPLLFLSGATIPFALLPTWVQGVGVFLPATHLVTGLQQVMLQRVSVLKVGPEILALAAGTAVSFFISKNLFRWEPEEKVTRRAKAWAVATVIPFLLFGIWESTNGRLRKDARSNFTDVVPRPTLPSSPSR